MKILKIQTLRGSNYWSIQRHQLVVVRLDLEGFQVQRNSFYQNLCKVLPSLAGKDIAHRPDISDGDFLAEIVKDIAIALQGYVGMNVDRSYFFVLENPLNLIVQPQADVVGYSNNLNHVMSGF